MAGDSGRGGVRKGAGRPKRGAVIVPKRVEIRKAPYTVTERDTVRTALREVMADRVPLVAAIADGEVMEWRQFPLADILPHVKCGLCGQGPVVPVDEENAPFLMIRAKVSASVRDRLVAIEMSAKYGVGTLREVSVENVRERVRQTLDVIRSQVTPEQADSIVQAIRPLWM